MDTKTEGAEGIADEEQVKSGIRITLTQYPHNTQILLNFLNLMTTI